MKEKHLIGVQAIKEWWRAAFYLLFVCILVALLKSVID